ncbi:MAG: LacI family DNA-binding transcriptional regulator [Lachnospiraceae bacterium]
MSKSYRKQDKSMSTIKDVAKYAGVSTATVSRVLNKKGPLSEKRFKR